MSQRHTEARNKPRAPQIDMWIEVSQKASVECIEPLTAVYKSPANQSGTVNFMTVICDRLTGDKGIDDDQNNRVH